LQETNELLLAAGGAIYMAMARAAFKRGETERGSLPSWLGLSLINCAKLSHFSGLDLLTFDVMQIALLGIIGLKYNLRPFRIFALLLSLPFFLIWLQGSQQHLETVAFGFRTFRYVKVGAAALAMFSSLALAYGRNVAPRVMHGIAPVCQPKSETCAIWYRTMANLLAMLMVTTIIDPNWQCVAFGLLAAANHILVVHRLEPAKLIAGAVAICACAAWAVSIYAEWRILPISLLTTLLYTVYFRARSVEQHPNESLQTMLRLVYGVGANVMLTVLLLHLVPQRWVSFSIGLESLAILAVGFLLPERFLRISGLSVIAVLVFKLLFVDMAHADTVQRVVSFISAGCVLLVSSYCYGKFTRAFEVSTEEPEPAPAEQPPDTHQSSQSLA
jgi:hypothetical protein